MEHERQERVGFWQTQQRWLSCSSDPELTEAGGEAGPAALEAAEILPWKTLPVWGGASSALRRERAASLLTPKFGILLCFTLLLGLSGGYSSSLASPLLAAPRNRPGGFLGPCPAAPCFLGTNQPRIAALPRPRS